MLPNTDRKGRTDKKNSKLKTDRMIIDCWARNTWVLPSPDIIAVLSKTIANHQLFPESFPPEDFPSEDFRVLAIEERNNRDSRPERGST